MKTKPEKYTTEQVLKAIEKNGGFLYAISRSLGCTPQTVLNYLHKYPELQEAMNNAREAQIDYAESKLQKAIANDYFPAIKFYLQTIGKKRGYVEKQEIEHSGQSFQIIYD